MLEGQTAVVSGGASGIGRAVVSRFAENGAEVEFVDINVSAVGETERELRARGFNVCGHVADLSDPGQVAAFGEIVASRHPSLGAQVNSVGIQRYGTAETTSLETWDEVFAVNVRSMFLLAKHMVPLMRRNGGGSIVNVSSVQAMASQRNVVAYAASKGAITAMTRAMAMDYAAEGIRVNTVLPGSVDTPMLQASARRVAPDESDRVVREWGTTHPIGRVAKPVEIADVCVFLASPLASYVTGAELRVDGGLLAGIAITAPHAVE